MDLYEIDFLRAEAVAEGTKSFHFAKPRGFAFEAGQFGNFSLVEPPDDDPAGNLRSFSFASAPHEGEIMVATRMRPSPFKRGLEALAPGATVEMTGPLGELRIEEGGGPLVFLAGGIGITPFLGMLRHLAHAGSAREVTLFYGNRTPEASPFLAELESLPWRLPRFRLVCHLSEPRKSATPWAGETGFLTEKLIGRHVADALAPLYYVVGPPAMTVAAREVLTNLGVDEGGVRFEEFAGY